MSLIIRAIQQKYTNTNVIFLGSSNLKTWTVSVLDATAKNVASGEKANPEIFTHLKFKKTIN